MLYNLIAAIGLVLIFEGILPFLSPNAWRKMALKLVGTRDRALRLMGLTAMLVGLALLIFAHFFVN